MKDQLYKLFISYIKYVKPYLSKKLPTLKKKGAKEKIRIAYIDSSSWLRSIVENIEGSIEFNNLVSNFSVAFGCKPIKEFETGSIISRSHVSAQRYKIQNFFRRSNCYLEMSEGKSLDLNYYFKRLWSAFNERQVKTISLRLLDRVCFPEPLIDFGKFKIQRLLKEEFDALVDNHLNHIFYPYAELDTDKLTHYWFIKEESYKEKQKVNFSIIDIGVTWNEVFRVSRAFPDRVIQLLSLFDWKAGWKRSSNKIEEDMGWSGFSIPVSLHITDDILESPYPSPDLSELEFFPVYDGCGEEIGESPQFCIHIEKDELERLKNIIEKSQEFLEKIDLKQCNWEFLDIAMGYLAKAFFAEGLEQLLWHITVLEALLGEKSEVMNSIRRRLGIIFGDGEKKEIEEIHKKFNELYEFRSTFVHGRQTTDKKIYLGHLRLARDFARRSVLWFINFLSFLHSELAKNGIPFDKYPQLKELLFLIDFHIQCLEKEGRSINMPHGFPNLAI